MQSRAPAIVVAAAILALGTCTASAYTGRDPIFTYTFLQQCSIRTVHARLGADGKTVKFTVDGWCPGSLISGTMAYRSGVFEEVFDLGAAGVLRARGTCSDNPWLKAARCTDVSVAGSGERIAALLAEHPYTPAGDASVPLTLNLSGAAEEFRKAFDNADRPQAPRAPVAVEIAQPVGVASVRVSWLAPDESGDRPFLRFVVHARPRASEGAAWIDVANVTRAGTATYSTTARLPPPVGNSGGWDIRVCSATGLATTCGGWQSPTSIAGRAALEGPSVRAASEANGTAARVSRALPPRSSDTTQSTCERAADALSRNSPAAQALAAKCRAEGGTPAAASLPDLDVLAADGEALAAEDALVALLRARLPEGDARRGFDIAIAAAWNQTEWGPGKQKLYERLSDSGRVGFRTATSYLFDRNRYAERARLGAAIAAADDALDLARSEGDDGRFRLGFDIATAIFGDPAAGAQGNTSMGAGATGIRNSLGPDAQRGFDAAVKFHLSRTY